MSVAVLCRCDPSSAAAAHAQSIEGAAAARLLSRFEGMKLIITSLIKAMPAVLNVTGVVIAFQLASQPWHAAAHRQPGSCTDPEIMERALRPGER